MFFFSSKQLQRAARLHDYLILTDAKAMAERNASQEQAKEYYCYSQAIRVLY